MKTRQIIRRLRGPAVGAAFAAILVLPPNTPAQAEESSPSSTAAQTADPDTVVIRDASAPRTYSFSVPVPKGGQLRALPGGEILVENAEGGAIGAYDQAWAQDAAGKYVPTRYRIEGTSLVQTVDLGSSVSYPVVIDPTYNPINADHDGSTILGFVGVPSNYVYNPSLSPWWAHDYCSWSPDEYPNPFGVNANFRGPCSRHDLCYQSGTSLFTCDNRFLDNLVSNCRHFYGWANPVRYSCVNAAGNYYAAVVANPIHP